MAQKEPQCGTCGEKVKGGHNARTCGRKKAHNNVLKVLPKQTVPHPVLQKKQTTQRGSQQKRMVLQENNEHLDTLVKHVNRKFGKVIRTFNTEGYEIALVGGSVRDALLGKSEVKDYDFTTNAHPNVVKKILSQHTTEIWDVGERFGTIAAQLGDDLVEITTYRSDTYTLGSRKPQVQYSTKIEEDLLRRDFTINAIAVTFPNGDLVDPHGGVGHLRRKVLKTPSSPRKSFTDDPLRMMRAARFVAQLGFNLDSDAEKEMGKLKDSIKNVSAERVRDEFSKTLLAENPAEGVDLLVKTGIAEVFVPEISALRINPIWKGEPRHKNIYTHSLQVLQNVMILEKSHHPTCEPDLELRLAALFHDVGKPKTRKFTKSGSATFHNHDVAGAGMVRRRLQALRYPATTVESVAKLTELHLRAHGYEGNSWTDAGVRRYIKDSGSLIDKLNKLTRADVTTKNRAKAQYFKENSDKFEKHIEEILKKEQESLNEPLLNGGEVMQILHIKPGPQVGEALKHMMEVRLERGPIGKDQAVAELRMWWEKLGN